jgi:hypothetical protein
VTRRLAARLLIAVVVWAALVALAYTAGVA